MLQYVNAKWLSPWRSFPSEVAGTIRQLQLNEAPIAKPQRYNWLNRLSTEEDRKTMKDILRFLRTPTQSRLWSWHWLHDETCEKWCENWCISGRKTTWNHQVVPMQAFWGRFKNIPEMATATDKQESAKPWCAECGRWPCSYREYSDFGDSLN
jgi:hypothetical protein